MFKEGFGPRTGNGANCIFQIFVVQSDTIIGDGTAGPISTALRQSYLELARAEFPARPDSGETTG